MDKYLESLVRKDLIGEVAPEADVTEEEPAAIELAIEETPVEEAAVKEPAPAAEIVPIEETVTESEQARAIGDEVFVESIRIFDRPGQTYPPHIFTGVVILDGAFESYTKVKYMKHGFGLVTGYTADIK